jgi:hypothetical protein
MNESAKRSGRDSMRPVGGIKDLVGAGHCPEKDRWPIC